MSTQERAVPLLFLDLDGTVRKGKDELGRFVNTEADVEVFPEAVTMMRYWKASGGRIAGVTNQAGIALGYFDLKTANATLTETNRQTGNLFDLIHMCAHAPDDECWCRKPGFGMLVQTVDDLHREHPGEQYPKSRMLMVGDRPEDEECARAAGVDFTWAADWRGEAMGQEKP